MTSEYIRDIEYIGEIINNNEMSFDELFTSFPKEVLEEYSQTLKFGPTTCAEKDFLKQYQ